MPFPLDDAALEAIAGLICGDEGPVYRAGWQLPKFFVASGLSCPDHNGATRKWWALDRIREYNADSGQIRMVISRLANPKEYKGDLESHRKTLTSLNQILALEGLRVDIRGVIPTIVEIEPSLPPADNLPTIIFPVPNLSAVTVDSALLALLESRWNEIQLCLSAGSYLACVILIGSLLEGALLSVFEAHPEQANKAKSCPKEDSGKPKQFADWKLVELLQVAHEVGWIRRDASEFANIVRDYRNLVHPYKQRESRFNPDANTCDLCWRAARMAIEQLCALTEPPDK